MNFIDRLTSLTEYGSFWILYLLVCLSVFALTIAIERAVLFFSSRDDVLALRRELRQLLHDGNLELARKRLEHSPSFEARVAVAGLDSGNAASAEERMRGENQVARLTMERNLAFLGTLGNNAPFIGLLGTVIGIVQAFEKLQNSGMGGGNGPATDVMGAIAEALVATAIGLIVAIPAVAAFNYFNRRIRATLSNSEALTHILLAYAKGQQVPAVPQSTPNAPSSDAAAPRTDESEAFGLQRPSSLPS